MTKTYLIDHSIKLRFIRGAIWSIIGVTIFRGLNLLSSIIIARTLGVKLYGELAILQSTINMLGVISEFGLSITATKYVAEYRKSDISKTGKIIYLLLSFSIMLGAFITIAIIINSNWISKNILKAPHLTSLLQVISVVIILSSLTSTQTGILAGFENFKTIAKINFITGILTFFLKTLGVIYLGLKGIVYAIVISMFLNFLLNKKYINIELKKNKIHIKKLEIFEEFPIIWKFSIPMFLSNILVNPVVWICNLILIRQPNGFKELGLFNMVNQFINVLMVLPSASFGVLLPILSSELKDAKNNFLHYINIHITTYISTVLTLGAIVFSDIIIYIYGKEFTKGYIPLLLLLLLIPILTYKSAIARLIQAKELVWYSFFSNSVWGLILILLTFKLVKWGAIGLSISYLISYLLNFIFFIPFFYRKLNIINFLKQDTLFFLSLGIVLIPAFLGNVLRLEETYLLNLLSIMLCLLFTIKYMTTLYARKGYKH